MSNESPLSRTTEYETDEVNGFNEDGPMPSNRSQVISAGDLRTFLHDMNGPLASARGFTEELVGVRRCIKDLIEKPNIGTDSELMASLQDQVDNEMEFCLDRVERSLVKLDSIIESIRMQAAASS